MQPHYNGEECVIILSKSNKKTELNQVLENRLEKIVNYSKNGQTTQIKISLEFMPSQTYEDNSNGIRMSFLPESTNWTEILVQINALAYNKLNQSGACQTNFKKNNVYINNSHPEM